MMARKRDRISLPNGLQRARRKFFHSFQDVSLSNTYEEVFQAETGKTLPPNRVGMNGGKRTLKVSAPKEKKDVPAGESGIRKQKRKKEKLIRLDDLIPKESVLGGRQYLSGATDINQTTNTQKET
jgi:hypothetical protein